MMPRSLEKVEKLDDRPILIVVAAYVGKDSTDRQHHAECREEERGCAGKSLTFALLRFHSLLLDSLPQFQMSETKQKAHISFTLNGESTEVRFRARTRPCSKSCAKTWL